ncbi:MAG TPA: Fe-Mn family superoxide dismutase [Pyrinomonadaceae bacterium]|nr:Fe-Mn family superoxide dismutase [Pyrinomonadaceae bacterium]
MQLKGLSEKLIRSHWENNYGGAVKALNAVEQRLAAMLTEKDLPAYVYGSGWVIFAHNAHTGEFHNYWSWDHMHNVPMGRPLLVLDMYEHAYHMDYGAAAAKYVEAFLQNVNWEEVNRRAEAVSRA